MRFWLAFIIVLINLLTIPGIGWAASGSVVVEGTILEAPAGILRIVEYGDMISYRERELAQTKIGADGKFRISFKVQETGLILIAVANFRGKLFVEPNKSYSLELRPYRQGSGSLSYLSTGLLEVKIIGNEESRLNANIEALESKIDSFISKEYERIYLRRDRRFVRNFVDSLGIEFQQLNHPFFNTYLEYSLGYLEYMGNLRTWESLRLKYFRNRKLEYDNPAYMDLFNALFEKYFIYYSKSIELDPLIAMVSGASAPKLLYEKCMSDTLFQGDQALAEMVMLLSLNDMFNSKEFRKEDVFSTLEAVKGILKNTMSKVVAINLLDQNISMIPGKPAPYLQGIDLNREKVELKSFKGRKVLLIFWDSSCQGCRDEFNFIAPYLRNKADSMVVLTVNVDRSFESFAASLKVMPPGLQYIYTGQDAEILEAYRISGLPLYILLNQNGEIIENPTISPAGDPNHFLLKVFGVR